MAKASNNDAMMISLADNKADIMTMANAFRYASDDDTRRVMNVMTNQTPTNLESLKFFAVTRSWFLRAWPILTSKPPDYIDVDVGDNLREYIGKIHNSELVVVHEEEADATEIDEKKDIDSPVPLGDLTEEEKLAGVVGTHRDHGSVRKNRLESHHRIHPDPETIQMKPGLVHTKDYFFLGPSAWMIVKEKFGYDGYEIRRSCKNAAAGAGQGVIAVALLPGEETLPTRNGNDDEATKLMQSTIIPVSGRFQYEKVFSSMSKIEDDVSMNSSIIHRAEVKSKLSLVDPKVEPHRAEQPLLLLPPSTTAVENETNDELDPLSSDNSKMELETNEDEDDDDDLSDNATTQISSRKRLASGLSNMGNTCFMNSTLQCLAHTESLRRYFLSGEYIKDLNRENPLGTGGELATQFASLMGEMWSEPSKQGNTVSGNTQNWKYSTSYSQTNSYSQAIYPRSFKNSLGKHAEQFMGYDQHDSQELATYLLDALHEDTNRVTKKPYIEKPEQAENESDTEAADTAWKMHLRREDSRVLENFMGQVKSRLECCEEGCDRVSTTFDPFMYLSVPIPGESERTMTVTFVPLDPNKRMQKLTLTIAKTATIAGLLEAMNEELVKTGICSESVPLHDLCAVEIYDKEIFKWHEHEDEVDGIKDYDKTYVYQLRSLEEVKKISSEGTGNEDTVSTDWSTSIKHKVKLDLSTLTELNKGDRWKAELEKYSKHRFLIYKVLNVSRSTIEEKIEFYKELETFLDECHLELEKDESSGLKRTREDDENPDDESVEMQSDSTAPEKVENSKPGMIHFPSSSFPNVRTRHDVGVLEFCANKLRQLIFNLMAREKEKNSEGVVIQIGIRQPGRSSSSYSTSRHGSLISCLAIRIPGNLCVYDLRAELAHRLSRSLVEEIPSDDVMQQTQPEDPSTELSANNEDKMDSESWEMDIMRRIRLSCDNADRGSSYKNSKSLGMLNKVDPDSTENGDQSLVAIASNEDEKVVVTTKVKNRGHIYLDLEQDDAEKVFDAKEFDETEVPDDGVGSSSKVPETDIQVLGCIENYCKKEQLEDSEMWYCNKCKKHVRAWKQFHLYRAPPILIVHLKRFFFSASSHRRDKITRKVEFPLEGLDLTGLVADYGDKDKPIYDCYAVSNHFGGLGGGHYTAYTRSDDGTWCNYDDSRVTTNVDPAEVVSEAAYVLYYRRRDVPVGQDLDLIVDTKMSPICAVVTDEACESSSTNNAQAMDLIVEDTDSNGSSKTALSPTGSIDNNDHNVAHSDDFIANARPLQ